MLINNRISYYYDFEEVIFDFFFQISYFIYSVTFILMHFQLD